MNVLIINQHFHPEVASSGQIMTELAADIVKAGHSVTALTGRPSYRSDVEIEKQSVWSIQVPREEYRKPAGRVLYILANILPKRFLEFDRAFGIFIVRTYTYTPKLKEGKLRFIQRMAQYISFFMTSFFTALFLPRHDAVIYLSTPPLLNGVTANALNLLKGTKNIYNIQDLYPDVAVKLGAVSNESIIRLCNMLERVLYSRASAIVPVGARIAEVLVKEKNVDRDKIHIIHNWMDTALIKPIGKDNPFSRQHGLLNKFVVMYSGNMGLSQGLDSVLRCAEITRGENIIYLLIGGGASRQDLESMAQDLGLDNVRFMPYQPKEKLSESLGAADVHLIPLKSGLSDYSVPSKLYGIMASGKPIIASVDHDSEIAVVVENAGCGMVTPPGDPEALAWAIRKLYNNQSRLDRLGMSGRDFLEKTNTREICTGRYIKILERVIST